MMSIRSGRGPTSWALALGLWLLPSVGLAQDGQLPTGPKTTAPGATGEAPLPEPAPVPAQVPDDLSEVLPPVPATAADPAPPGTRAVRVDAPRPVEGSSAPHPGSTVPIEGSAGAQNPPGVPGQPGVAAPADRERPDIRVAEGVVTSLKAPENLKESDAKLIVTIDTSITWEERYGGAGPPDAPTAARPEDATLEAVEDARKAAEAAAEAAQQAQKAAEQAAEGARSGASEIKGGVQEAPTSSPSPGDPSRPADGQQGGPGSGEAQGSNQLTFAITDRTQVYTFARTAEGVDLYGATTFSSPDDPNVQTGGVTGEPVPRRPGPRETNFTMIREKSFVAVRYRAGEGRNEALSVSLIELPVNAPETPPGTAVDAGQPAAGTAPTRQPAPTAAPGGLEKPIVETPGGVVEPVPEGGQRAPDLSPEGRNASPAAVGTP